MKTQVQLEATRIVSIFHSMRARLSLKSEVRSGLSLSFATSIAIQGMTVVTGVMIARGLGPDGRGELTTSLLWPTLLAALGSVGLTELIAFYTARETHPLETIAGTALSLAIIQSLILGLLGFFAIPLLLRSHNSSTITSAAMYLGFIPLNLFTIYCMAMLNGLRKFFLFNIARVLVLVMTLIPMVVLAAIDNLTVRTAVEVYLGANAITASFALVSVVRCGIRTIKFRPDVARQLLGFGIRSHLSNVSGVMNERLDQLLMSIFLTSHQLGLYVVAVTLTSAITLVGGSVALVLLPVIAREMDEAAKGRRAAPLIQITAVVSGLGSILLFLLAPRLIQVFFGARYSESIASCRILIVAAFVLSMNRVLAATLKGANRPLESGQAEIIALLLTGLGLGILLRPLGIEGAAITSLIAYMGSFCWMSKKLRDSIGLSLRNLVNWKLT